MFVADLVLAELQRLGFETVFEPSVFDAKSYLAGEPATRAAAFLKAWRDPSVRAIVAVRGGYGSVHVLPFLDAKELRRDPTAFIFSGKQGYTPK